MPSKEEIDVLQNLLEQADAANKNLKAICDKKEGEVFAARAQVLERNDEV